MGCCASEPPTELRHLDNRDSKEDSDEVAQKRDVNKIGFKTEDLKLTRKLVEEV